MATVAEAVTEKKETVQPQAVEAPKTTGQVPNITPAANDDKKIATGDTKAVVPNVAPDCVTKEEKDKVVADNNAGVRLKKEGIGMVIGGIFSPVVRDIVSAPDAIQQSKIMTARTCTEEEATALKEAPKTPPVEKSCSRFNPFCK